MIFYCISFFNGDRKKRMQYRLSSTQIDAVFVQPVATSSPELLKYTQNLNQPNLVCASLTLTTLKILQIFLNTTNEWCVICEDDVHIRKSIKKDLESIIESLESTKDTPRVVLCGYLCNSRYNFQKVSGISNANFTFSHYPADVWGTQMYLCNREAAKYMLENYDKPFDQLQKTYGAYGADWLFTKTPHRCLIYPMLAVEEDYGKDYGDVNQTNYHRSCNKFNYSEEYL